MNMGQLKRTISVEAPVDRILTAPAPATCDVDALLDAEHPVGTAG